MPRPALTLVLLVASLTAVPGCHHHHAAPADVGLIPAGEMNAAQFQNSQRLAGEDHRRVSPIRDPFQYLGHAISVAVLQPVKRSFAYVRGDTPGAAARQMLDASSADNRRAGTLKLVGYPYLRNGDEVVVFNRQANDDDYTVRAAGIRALNRCRARGYTTTYVKGLEDEQNLVRLEAAKALANVPDDAAVAPLISHLQNDTSKDVRVACADALRAYRTIEVAHALIDRLPESDFSIAWQSRQSLMLITKHDYRYDRAAWLEFLSRENPFG